MEKVVVTEAPAETAITRAELKDYCRVTTTAEDTYIDLCIDAAQTQAEKFTGMKFISQEVEIYIDKFPLCRILELALVSPIISIDKIEYVASGATVFSELSSDDYEIDILGKPTRIYTKDMFPMTELGLNKVRITATVGYADASAVPEDIKTAIKMIGQHLFDNRGMVTKSGTPAEIPMSAEWLLEKYKLVNY